MQAKHPPKHTFLLFFGISLVSFMTGVDLLGTGLALTPISHQFGVNFSTLQWFLTAFAMGNSSFLVTSGKLIDIYGSRRIFSLGVMLFVASSIFITLTPNFLYYLYRTLCSRCQLRDNGNSSYINYFDRFSS